jgi:hypothetical protein
MVGDYPYHLFDEKGKVICQICGKSFLIISPRHLKKHNISHGDYKARFPNAPLSTEEFKARGKYGRTKLFPPKDEIGDETIVDEKEEEIDVEEIAIKKVARKIYNSPMESMKAKILDHLKMRYFNIKQDYLIRQFGSDQRLKFEFITDYCDPVLKVIIQFPDTFWHNVEAAVDLNKNVKLKKYHWKIIEIPTVNPSFELIDKYLDES